jgi:hypothetical protein
MNITGRGTESPAAYFVLRAALMRCERDPDEGVRPRSESALAFLNRGIILIQRRFLPRRFYENLTPVKGGGFFGGRCTAARPPRI